MSRFFGVLMLGLVAIYVKWFVKDLPQGAPVQPAGNDGPIPGLPTLQSPGLLSEHLEVVFVLDPNFHLCWEHIPVDDWTRATILPWVKGLKDFFAEDDDLQVHHLLRSDSTVDHVHAVVKDAMLYQSEEMLHMAHRRCQIEIIGQRSWKACLTKASDSW